ncbi:MAG: uracil-DNA glycosylase [Mycobacterium sp.]|nr:uracil-DNA glycosylase [Mycobacterium sp.]
MLAAPENLSVKTRPDSTRDCRRSVMVLWTRRVVQAWAPPGPRPGARARRSLRVIGAVRRSRSTSRSSSRPSAHPFGTARHSWRRRLRAPPRSSAASHLADPGVGSGPYDRRQPGPVSEPRSNSGGSSLVTIRKDSEGSLQQRKNLLDDEIRSCSRCAGMNKEGVTQAAPGWGNLYSPVVIVGQSLCEQCMKPQEPFFSREAEACSTKACGSLAAPRVRHSSAMWCIVTRPRTVGPMSTR